MKKLLFFAASLLLLVSCDSKSGDDNGKDSGDFSLNPTSVNLVMGESKRITVVGGSSSTQYVWESSDTLLAQVDNRGNVTANDYLTGDVTITCRLAKNLSAAASCDVHVISFGSIAKFDNNVFWYKLDENLGVNADGDSLGTIGFYILSQGLYANESGKLDGNGGLLIDIESTFRYIPGSSYYILGEYAITDHPYDTIVSDRLAEHCVLAAEFDENMFLDFCDKAYWPEEGAPDVDRDDYPYLTGLAVLDAQPKTDGSGYSLYEGGYVKNGSHFNLLQDQETKDLYISSYDLDCVVFTGWHGLALQKGVDESTGAEGVYFVRPLQLSAENHHYVKAEEAETASVKEQGVSRETIVNAIRYNKAMFSVMMTKMDKHSLIKK